MLEIVELHRKFRIAKRFGRDGTEASLLFIGMLSALNVFFHAVISDLHMALLCLIVAAIGLKGFYEVLAHRIANSTIIAVGLVGPLFGTYMVARCLVFAAANGFPELFPLVAVAIFIPVMNGVCITLRELQVHDLFHPWVPGQVTVYPDEHT